MHLPGPRVIVRWLKAAFLGSTMVAALVAQPPAPVTKAKLEVASVKPSAAGRGMVSARIGGDRITLENYPLRDMIGAAYGVRPSELLGGPAWIASARYDILAKAEKPANGRALWTMMQSVLQERFGLKVHPEKKEMPVFSLSVAKYSKLREIQFHGDCLEVDPTAPLTQPTRDRPALPRCGYILFGPARPAGVQLSGARISTEQLARRLTDIVGRHVIDKTGFTGTVNLQLIFARDDALHGIPPQGPDLGGAAALAPADPSGLPSIFTALRDQLGLKLVPANGSVAVLVIDSVERPSAN